MKRILNVASTVLMLAGLAVALSIGWQYVHKSDAAASPSWTASQKQQGERIQKQLVNLPRRLGHGLPQTGSELAARIVIPKINVDAPVIETPPQNGVWQVADWSAGHLTTTPNPGAPGNDAISAHDDIKGEIFKRLGELRPGDSIRLYTRHAVYTYIVTNQIVVDPSNLDVLKPTQGATVTLISCAPYWVDTQRLIVQAALKTRAAA